MNLPLNPVVKSRLETNQMLALNLHPMRSVGLSLKLSASACGG
jgi:hypothetical protein